MIADIAPVLKIFPERAAAIEKLALRDDEFLTLCADLSDAQAAVQRWQVSSEEIANERRLQFEALVRDLAREIEVALDAVVVISLSDKRSNSTAKE